MVINTPTFAVIYNSTVWAVLLCVSAHRHRIPFLGIQPSNVPSSGSLEHIAGSKKNQKEKKQDKETSGGVDKKDRWFRQAQKAPNKWANRDFIAGCGIFGLLPTSILKKIGDSLPRASDRYTYTASVPNMYHSVGRGGVGCRL